MRRRRGSVTAEGGGRGRGRGRGSLTNGLCHQAEQFLFVQRLGQITKGSQRLRLCLDDGGITAGNHDEWNRVFGKAMMQPLHDVIPIPRRAGRVAGQINVQCYQVGDFRAYQ